MTYILVITSDRSTWNEKNTFLLFYKIIHLSWKQVLTCAMRHSGEAMCKITRTVILLDVSMRMLEQLPDTPSFIRPRQIKEHMCFVTSCDKVLFTFNLKTCTCIKSCFRILVNGPRKITWPDIYRKGNVALFNLW